MAKIFYFYQTTRNQSPLIAKALDIKYSLALKNNSVKWGCINAVLFSIVMYDLKWKCPYHTTVIHYIEYVLVFIFGLNTIYHFILYLYRSLMLAPLSVTRQQKKLLGFKDNDTSFTYQNTPDDHPIVSEKTTPLNLSARSWLTNSPANDNSANQSAPSTSWTYINGSSPVSYHSQHDYSWQNDSITDEQSLQEYLRNVEEKEKIASFNSSMENSPKDSSIFWNHTSTRVAKDVSPMFKRTQYQLAPLNSEIHHMLGMNEEGSIKSMQSSPQLWNKLHVDSQNLIQWNANIRKWISTTVLDRVIKAIQSIDDTFLKCGLTDIRIGHVGLDRLKKTATLQMMQHIPALSVLIPFLEISNNQEYLVQRIKELASGGCMSDYKWNGGGNLHGKNWDESLPTDSAIIMHFFATYLDTQLMPITQNPEGLPFSSQHYCKMPDKPAKNQDSLIIYQTSISPPNYVLIVGEDTCAIPKGRNNLIHTLLLFLYTVASKYHGMLGRMNLGKSGVNVLWVVDQ